MVAIAFSKINQLFLIVLAGFALKKARLITSDDGRKLVLLNTYTFLPALIFKVIYHSRFMLEYVFIPIIGLLLMLVMTVIAFIIGWFIGLREKKYLMPFVVASSAGNTGYVGYPVCQALFGEKGLALAVAYDIFATVFYALIVAALLISYGAGKTEKISKLVASIFTFPPTIAAIAALILKPFPLPQLILQALDFASQAAIPLTLVALGISLEGIVNFNYLKQLLVSVTLKLGVSPTIAALIVPWFLKGMAAKITIIQTGMPALMLTYILSVRYDTEPEYASFLVFFSTFLSIFTLPVLIHFINS
jgi:predicted permease